MRKNTIIGLAVGFIVVLIFSSILYLFRLPSTIRCSYGDKTFSECSVGTWNNSSSVVIENLGNLVFGKVKGLKPKSKKQSEI